MNVNYEYAERKGEYEMRIPVNTHFPVRGTYLIFYVWFGIAPVAENIKRFTKREKKLKPKCLPGSGCPKKIRRLERHLVLKEVANRKGCLLSEVEAS